MCVDTEHIVRVLSQYLPSHIHEVCKRYLSMYPDISEIRLRKNQPIFFTIGAQNIYTDYICDTDSLEKCLGMMTKGSSYKYSDYIIKGILPLAHGFRAGIAGEMILSNGVPKALCSISSLNLRIPHYAPNFSLPLVEHLLSLPYSLRSVLVIAPPCGGKTTLLRDLAIKLSTPPVSERVCVVDTNRELSVLTKPSCSIDFLEGYPIELGIESATHYLNPQYIICDEISNKCDINALKNSAYSGVAFIASAHASSYKELICKPDFNDLIRSGIFYSIATLYKSNDAFTINIQTAQESEVT